MISNLHLRRLYALSILLAGAFLYPASTYADPLDPNAFTSLGTLNVTSGTLTINTDTLQITGSATFTGVAYSPAGGPQIAVFDFSSINIGSGVSVTGQGSRALAFLSTGNATFFGMGAITFVRGPVLNYSSTVTQSFSESGTGLGAGWGFAISSSSIAAASGGSYGGGGGPIDISSTLNPGPAANGDIYSRLDFGSSGGAASNSSGNFVVGGYGSGAVELGAIGTLTVGSVSASGGVGTAGAVNSAAGGGSGGSILLHSNQGITFLPSTTLSASGGNGATTGTISSGSASGGGGGRIGLSGLATYTLGTTPAGVSIALNGGTGSRANAAFASSDGFAGVVTIDALANTIPASKSFVLDGTPVVSIVGSTTRTSPTYEAYIRKDLIVDPSGTATLGIDNALKRLDSSGNNVTSLTVNGTFNTGSFSQILATLAGTGTVNIGSGGALTVTGGSTFNGTTAGQGQLIVRNNLFLTNTTLSPTVGILNEGTLHLTDTAYNGTISSYGYVNTYGAVSLLGNNTFTGEAFVNIGTLTAGSNALATAAKVTVVGGATLSVPNGATVKAIDLNGGTVSGGNLVINGSTASVISGLGTLSGAGDLIKSGTGTLTISSGNFSSHAGKIQVQNGLLSVSGGSIPAVTGSDNAGTVIVGAGAELRLLSGATIGRPVDGAAASSLITAQGGSPVTLGNANSFSGFHNAGILTIATGTNVTLNSKGLAQLGTLTTLAGSTLSATNGVSFGTGANFSGFGTVSAKVASGFGSTIEASGGNLAIGNVASSVGFVSDGELYTGTNTVTLNDSNQAVLGSYTQIGSGGSSGTLTATNGLVIDIGKNLEGQGTINSTNTLAKAVIMNGYANGTGTGLEFNGYVKGIGTFDGTIIFNGTYSPGLSPTSTSIENLVMGSAGTLQMELGGLGLGSQYDHLDILSSAQFDGTLDLTLINGFQPALGDQFNLFDGSLAGSFDAIHLPGLASGLQWDTSSLYSSGEVGVTALPEPGTFVIFGLGFIGLCGYSRRRRNQATGL